MGLTLMNPTPITIMSKISRSFSRKLNLGNYETCDFFCAREAEEMNSEELFQLCKKDVEVSIKNFQADTLREALKGRVSGFENDKTNLQVKLKLEKDPLKLLELKQKSNMLSFHLKLLKDELNWIEIR